MSLLLQPTVTMSVLSLSALGGGGGDVVLGLIGLTVYIVPCVYLGWMTTARLQCIAIPELSTTRKRRGQEAHPSKIPIVVEVLVAERVKWVSQRREARVYYRHFGAVFEGYVGGRTWFVWIEMGTGLAYGVLTGFEPSTDAGCRAQLWVNFVLSVAILASAALWPYNGLLWNLNYALNAAVMMAVAVLMVLKDDDASGVVAMVAAWVAVAFTLFDTTLRAVVGGLANALRRLVGLIPRDTTLWNGTFVPLTNVPLKLQKRRKRSDASERSISDVFVTDRHWLQPSSTTKAQVRALRDLIELIAKDRKVLCVEEEWVA
ncbi:membrane-associated protein, putative [Bodo saltans]|uniref:Membrane-associated protein, putative n=1 Tax=Bodo saltans TaxID=75058 RepID=A0A0S4JD42_BODSA|nr:membrane-associated protein, putative [Bodo saltans]|eukprot:CUG89473.1 membrane-associated protein, putative [Bodo saltans]